MSISAYIYSVNGLSLCYLEQNYFFKNYHDLDVNTFVFQIFQGTIIMNNNIFERLLLSVTVYCFFDIETCNSYMTNTTFTFDNLPSDMMAMFIDYWGVMDFYINSTNFIVESFGFAYGLIEGDDTVHSLMILNSNFITLNKDENNATLAIYSSGCPYVYLENNVFVNFQCKMDSKEIVSIVGPISFQGTPSFSSVDNDLELNLVSNYFINCSCIYGGSLGILNYNKTYLENITSIGGSAILGGAFFLLNCYQINLNNSLISQSTASRGSGIYIKKNQLFKINNTRFIKSFGYQTGVIEARFAVKIQIDGSNFILSTSGKICSTICLYSSQLEIYNTSIEQSKSISYGGVIYLNDLSNISIISVFSNISSSVYDGGFLYAQSTYKIEINYTNIINSFTNSSAAALFINNVIEFNLNEVSFISCESKLNGILFMMSLQNSLIISINLLLCFNNNAILGSCIFYSNPSNIEINGLNCFNNFGTIMKFDYAYSFKLFISNGNFSNNDENNYLFLINTIIAHLINFNFNNNLVLIDIIYIENGIINMTNFTFYHPLRQNNFGDDNENSKTILSSLNCDITVSGLFFQAFDISSESNLLMLFYLESSNLTFYDLFIKNNVFQINTLILFEKCNSTIENSVFLNNSGPIIKAIDSSLMISNCYFKGNIDPFQIANDIQIENSQNQIDSYNSFYSFNNIFEISNGLSLYTNLMNKIIISNSIYLGISSNYSMSLSFVEVYNINLKLCLFFNLKASKASAFQLLLEFDLKSYLVIDNSSFLNCESQYFGIIYIIGGNINITIMNNYFLNNRGLFDNSSIKNDDSNGGVLVLLSKSQNTDTFNLINNIFLNNSAKTFPTVYSNIFINETNNEFFNNLDYINMTNITSSAPYQINLTKISCDILPNMGNQQIYQISSGIAIQLEFIVTDSENQRVIYDNVSVGVFQKPKTQINNTIIKKIQNNIIISNQGLYHLDKFLLYVLPNETFIMELDINFFDLYKIPYILSKSFNFYSRSCILGEILSLDLACLRCPVNYFSLDDPMENINIYKPCKSCIENAFCPGGNLIIPNPGYWRMSSDSLFLGSCLNPAYCIGLPNNVTEYDIINDWQSYEKNESILQGFCYPGHEKNLCHECIIGFGKYTNNSTCQICKDYDASLLLRMFLIISILIGYLIINSQSMIHERESSVFSEVSKIYINHMQKIALVAFFDLNKMIDSMKQFLNFLSFLNIITEDIFSNDCFIQFFIVSKERYNFYIVKIFITMIMPIIISLCSIIIFMLFVIFQRFFRKIQKQQKFIIKIFLIFFICIFIFYPLLTKTSLSLLNCISLDDSTNICTTVLMFYVGVLNIIYIFIYLDYQE